MKRSSFMIFATVMFLVTLISTILIACDSEKEISCDDTPLQYTTDCKTTAPGEDMTEVVESELPPESFVGTVLEEDTYYMVVEPNIDEEEYSISDRIRVEYIHDHIDYLYGIGRKVVITYIPPFDGDKTIVTDDIRHDGFEEFELSVQYKKDSLPKDLVQNYSGDTLVYIANSRDFDKNASDFNLYYLGLEDVYVKVDGDTLPLKEALSFGKVTLDGIIAECNRLSSLGLIKDEEYKDGGSVLYDFSDFKIIKYHTLDGNRDIFIGTSDMNINAHGLLHMIIRGYRHYDFGLRLDTKDVSGKGATIVFNQKGGNVTGELVVGDEFYLERKNGNKWISVDTKPLIDYAFHMVAYRIFQGGKLEFRTDWEWLYGELGTGQYRIKKEVMDFKQTADYVEQVYYAYFDIE